MESADQALYGQAIGRDCSVIFAAGADNVSGHARRRGGRTWPVC